MLFNSSNIKIRSSTSPLKRKQTFPQYNIEIESDKENILMNNNKRQKTESSRSSSPSIIFLNSPKSEILCKYYGSANGCRFGSSCYYSHSNPNSIPICRYINTPSGCNRGDNCYYRHQQHVISSKTAGLNNILGLSVYSDDETGFSIDNAETRDKKVSAFSGMDKNQSLNIESNSNNCDHYDDIPDYDDSDEYNNSNDENEPDDAENEYSCNDGTEDIDYDKNVETNSNNKPSIQYGPDRDEPHPEIVIAARNNNINQVLNLIEKGVDINKRRIWTEVEEKYFYEKRWEWHDNSALMEACLQSNEKMVQLLLLNGADPTLRSCWTCDKHHTALEIANKKGNINIVNMINHAIKLWESLNPHIISKKQPPSKEELKKVLNSII